MHPKQLSIKDFTYELPASRIAEKPLAERDASKLLLYSNGEISESIYRNIAAYLPEESFIIFNDTRVIPARILFQKITGGVIEIFCLEPVGDYVQVLNSHQPVRWRCMIGGAGKWKSGPLQKIITVQGDEIKLNVILIEKLSDAYVAEFSWSNGHFSFGELLHAAGEMPLPPYIKRKAEESDKERYQTIFAREEGSVAAPTAALHFTPHILESLKEKNIETDFVTLHVGAGTFKPVKSEKIEGHDMHAEWIDVSLELIEKLSEAKDQKITAVGTTSLRTLESLYWMGVKVHLNKNITAEQIFIHQWDVYEELLQSTILSREKAFRSLSDWMKKNQLQKLITQTQILIAPGYTFKAAQLLVTNFHQPQSTLLLLIAAALGDDWKKVYNYALQNNFRFLSYGDGCLLPLTAQ